jgi:hypothetical protein
MPNPFSGRPNARQQPPWNRPAPSARITGNGAPSYADSGTARRAQGVGLTTVKPQDR